MNAPPTEVAILTHVPHEPPGIIADALRQAGLRPLEVPLYEPSPPTIDWGRAAALVVMGGPMNVDQTDRYPFLAEEVDWIKSAIDRQLPVLGVCLGSQLIAKALGARVYPGREKEIGWYPIELTSRAVGDPLFGPLPTRPTVFQWHGDTFDLPEGAELLATSEACAHQAFRHGEHVYALQFHVEVTGEIIESWLGEPGNQREMAELPRVDPEEIRRRMGQELTTMLELGRAMMDRFANLCRNESP